MAVTRIVAVVGMMLLSGTSAGAQVLHEQGPWSVGAGLHFGGLGGGTVGSLAPGSSILLPQVAEPTLTLERRVGHRVSLLGAITAGFVQSNLVPDESPPLGPQTLSGQQGNASVALGARIRATADDAPVAASAYVVVHGGYTAFRSTQPAVGTTTLVKTLADAFGGGLTAGFSAEKVLTDGLSVRVSSSLVGASYTDGFIRTTIGDTETEQTTTSLTLGLRVIPSVELRLHF